MQIEPLMQIKQQIILLDEESKQSLAEFLAEELHHKNELNKPNVSDEERQKQIEWLKRNREKYAGKYVALSGDKLVGEGKTLREANERAKNKGYQNIFLTLVYSENDVPFGGW